MILCLNEEIAIAIVRYCHCQGFVPTDVVTSSLIPACLLLDLIGTYV